MNQHVRAQKNLAIPENASPSDPNSTGPACTSPDQISSLLTALTLTDEGTNRPSKLWASSTEHIQSVGERIAIGGSPLTLDDARASASAILEQSARNISPSNLPPLNTPCSPNPRPTAWIRKANVILSAVEDEAKTILASLHDPVLLADIVTLCDTHNAASQFLSRGSASVASIKHRDVQDYCSQVLSVLRDIQRRLEELAPRIPPSVPHTGPIIITSTHGNRNNILHLDSITQVMILLGVVCHFIIGLSTEPCEFIIGVVTLLVKMAMSTYGHRSSFTTYSESQEAIIEQLPTSLYTAMKRFDLDGNVTTLATCPSCNYTHSPISDSVDSTITYPSHCLNKVAGDIGLVPCNAPLLRADSQIPAKPYLVQSFRHYLADLFLDAEIEALCDQACDEALRWQSDSTSPCDNEVFRGEFFRSFTGPNSNKLFIDRGDRARLAFIMHVDFFNPNRTTNRGPTTSVGVISLALLNLPKHMRDKPEHVFVAGIIPGPKEPALEELNHFLKPIIDEFEVGWTHGFHIAQTPNSPQGRDIDIALAISTNDLPGARKVSGTQGVSSHFLCTVCNEYGRHNVQSVNFEKWQSRDVQEMRRWATAWKDATTIKYRKHIFDRHGVRWSELWRLPYWDPTRMLVIDSMHCVLEGLAQYHCRHVLCLTTQSPSSSAEDSSHPAFIHAWPEYDPDMVPPGHCFTTQIEFQQVGLIQRDLCRSIGSTPLPAAYQHLLKKLVKRNKKPLIFVCQSLALPNTLSRRSSNGTAFTVPAKTKNHYAELLAQWRMQMPLNSSSPNHLQNKAAIMTHIQRVITSTVTPSWVNSVPSNYGDAAAGSIKADEWRTLTTLYLPIALVTLWNDDNGSSPDVNSPLTAILDHTMALFQSITILCRDVMTPGRAADYRIHLKQWVQDLRKVHPHTAAHASRPNIHAAFHIYDFMLLFGPIMAWWTFPFERMIGGLQKIKTSDMVGGPLEATMLKSWIRGANLRRWLRRPDCPEMIRQFKYLFDKAFTPGVTAKSCSARNKEVAHYVHLDKRYSRASTHLGNSLVVYFPSKSTAQTAFGSIQKIHVDHDGRATCVIQRQAPLQVDAHDPFRRYPSFPAITLSSDTSPCPPDKVGFEDVLGHASKYDFSNGRSVFVNMSRI